VAIKRELSVADKHQIRIAKQTLAYSDEGAKIMGGMTKDEAKIVLGRFGLDRNRRNKHDKPLNERIERKVGS
jgi:hypothetical protein